MFRPTMPTCVILITCRLVGNRATRSLHDFSTDCAHGAQLEMSYTANPGDNIPEGQSFHWIQRVHTWGGFCGWSGGNQIDCTQGPYYYDPNEDLSIAARGHPETWFLDAPQNGCGAFGQSCPGDQCPAPCDWGAGFWTFIAYGTPSASDTGTLTVYDGVFWGFQATCVPEASTSVLFIVGLLVLLFRRRASASVRSNKLRLFQSAQ